MLEDDESFKAVSWDMANLISVVTKSYFKITEDKECVDFLVQKSTPKAASFWFSFL